MTDFASVSPLKILEKSSRGGLGAGNLGVLIARAGVGKTACLIHIALDRILRREKLLHVSIGENPDKVASYYRVICSDLVKALEMKDESDIRLLIDRNRMILAYLKQSFRIDRLEVHIENLVENIGFTPDTVIVDGLDFETAERSLFEEFKGLADRFRTEIWFSALSHRHLPEMNPRGIPHPCHLFDDLFGIIIQLESGTSGTSLRLLKDHGNAVAQDAALRLDPNTFLVMKPFEAR